MLRQRVSARQLAEFSLEGGDLFPSAQAAERMQEGMRVHKMRQSAYEEGFESEVSLSVERIVQGLSLRVFGRADGVNRRADPPVVEEIKLLRGDTAPSPAAGLPVHWAQLELYGFMLSEADGAAEVELRLRYARPDGSGVTHKRRLSREALEERFFALAAPYAAWVSGVAAWREESAPTLKGLSFPYAGFRAGQREMAAACYRAIRDGHNLLCQAPTGIGKTMAALFAALKALGEGRVGQVFYLTARTTQRIAAEDALSRMRKSGLKLRSITLTAKEKLCVARGASCDPALCPRARGYFDRRRDALRDALGMEGIDRSALEDFAREKELCPFELQLDIAETAELVICDYNYVFDPRVKLKRFFLGSADAAILVDEAHNLPARARDMLSAELRRSAFEKLRKNLLKAGDKASPLCAAVEKICLALAELGRANPEPASFSEAPESALIAADDFLDAARPFLGSGGVGAELADRYYEALNFVRVSDDMDESYAALVESGGRETSVRLWCLHPAPYLKKCMKKLRASVLFSATLSPLSYYASELGLDEDAGDLYMDLPSPFPEENLLVLSLPIATRYASREATAADIAAALAAMARAHTGNYLACFPSYAYLNLVLEAFSVAFPQIPRIAQRAGMTEKERLEFIDRFQPDAKESLLAFVAMGGVFAEGIDLPGERLSGAAIVSVALPQLSFEKGVYAAKIDEFGEGEGYLRAYVYPGLQRVMQAAGRVIRTEEDRGVVLLLDERFEDPAYKELLPPHWHPRLAKSLAAAEQKMKRFWRD